MAIDEAIHMAGEESNRVTNFITDHSGFGLDTQEDKSQFIQDIYGVGERQGSAVKKEILTRPVKRSSCFSSLQWKE